MKRLIPKVEIIQLYNLDVYSAVSKTIEEYATQENIIFLDSNIQISKKFIQSITNHFAPNNLYTFKVNDIHPNNTVHADVRLGNKITPAMFNIGAVAFQKSDAQKVGSFKNGDLVDFAYRMVDKGITIKHLNQVLCYRVTNNTHIIIDSAPRHPRTEVIELPMNRQPEVTQTGLKTDEDAQIFSDQSSKNGKDIHIRSLIREYSNKRLDGKQLETLMTSIGMKCTADEDGVFISYEEK